MGDILGGGEEMIERSEQQREILGGGEEIEGREQQREILKKGRGDKVSRRRRESGTFL